LIKIPSADILKEIDEDLKYDHETGIITWFRSKTNRYKPGHRAGYIERGDLSKGGGYRRIGVRKEKIFAHHIAWYKMTGKWPEQQLDHINGKRDDNRACNLRTATGPQNHQNKAGRKVRNHDLPRGVFITRKNGKEYIWAAIRIVEDGKRKKKHLGSFKTIEEAAAAYSKVQKESHGEFKHLNI